MESKRALITMSQYDQSKRFEHCHELESSTAPHPAYGEPMSLNLGRKVFLSHSGRDKEFVRRLYRDLCSSYHGIEVAFFDEETLPKGKAISMEKSILEEARGSALGVLVLTDDFFMHTRNPMLELEAFVAGNVDLLPLFLTMSVDEFKEEERWNRWEKKWEEWAAADDKLVIEKWRSYLKFVRTYNGLEFCKIAPAHRQDLYIDEVVKQVAGIIGPAVPMSGEDVYGKGRLCRMVEDMYKICTFKRSSPTDRTTTQIASTSANLDLRENNGLYAYDVVGIYGFAGLGKTTLCKCLCDFYFGELKGNVCYMDLGLSSEPRHKRMQHVLSRLGRRNGKDILQLNSIQVENLLKERLSSLEDPVFLAIDNIPPETKSREEALMYLRCKFPKGSKILITSRTRSTLTNLISLLPHSCSSSAVIEYMPALEFEEARDIFQHEFPDLHNGRRTKVPAAIEENLHKDVIACVRKCTIFKGVRYHPLMLKSLAAFVKWDELTPSLDWKGRLAKLASEGIIHKDDAWDQVFQVFDITYTLLADEAKKVFLDLALCYSATTSTSHVMDATIMDATDYHDWIENVHLTHNLREREIEKLLLRLHNFCFIVKEGRRINIEGLMVEFGKHKAGAGAGADSDGYLVLEDGAHWPDALPRTARHVSISRCGKELRILDLRAVEGVTVLHLLDNAGLEEVRLSHITSAHLRSIIVSVPACTTLRCIVNEDWSSQSLKWLKIQGNFHFCFQPSQRSLMLPDAQMDPGSMFSGFFWNLVHLSLDSSLPSNVQSIDLTYCANLKQLKVMNIPRLEELALTVPAYPKTKFEIWFCKSLQRVSLNCTTPSISSAGRDAEPKGSLSIFGCPLVANVDGLSQYQGSWWVGCCSNQAMLWTEICVDMLKETGIDSSRCKARARVLSFEGYNPAGLGLGGVTALRLEEAEHIWPLISAMSALRELHIQCRQTGDGSCGCDQNAPNFGTFPTQAECDDKLPVFTYCCPKVKDLSSLAQWRCLRELSLKGCTSVEVWPDFAACMTSLEYLNLSNTSLRELPAGLHLLSGLRWLDVSGCQQLPAKELILGVITPSTGHWYRQSVRICWLALKCLMVDLKDGTRDRRMVADALDALSQELAALFDGGSPDYIAHQVVLHVVLKLIREVWFGGRGGDDDQEHITEIMRGLLSSESFLSLPFRTRKLCFLGMIGVLGITLVGGGASSAYSYCALPAVNDHHLRDSTIFFFKYIVSTLIKVVNYSDEETDEEFMQTDEEFMQTDEETDEEFMQTDEVRQRVREKVEVALCRMAREAGLEVEEGDTNSEKLEELIERCVVRSAGYLARKSNT